MEVLPADNKIAWDNWTRRHSERPPFTQSWQWGEILLSEGKKVERLAVMRGNETVAQALIVYMALPFGRVYGFCPQGPVFIEKLEALEAIVEFLKNKNCIFFRFEPAALMPQTKYRLQNTADINPRATTILDLGKTESELLAGMREKTRYNIRLAERKNLTMSDKKDFDILLGLLQETGKRDGFSLHPREHYRQILLSQMSRQLSIAAGSGAIIATAVFIGYGNTFTYLYGASDYAARALMAPYLLQWQGIKLGKKLGYKYYDFFGIAPGLRPDAVGTSAWQAREYEYDKSHQYGGVTRFKLGFGGAPWQNPGTFDLIISPGKYRIYQILRKIRRIF